MMPLLCFAVLLRNGIQTHSRRSFSCSRCEVREAGLRSGIRTIRSTGSSSLIHAFRSRNCCQESSVVPTRVSAPCPNP
jgi:hypothetical protein